MAALASPKGPTSPPSSTVCQETGGEGTCSEGPPGRTESRDAWTTKCGRYLGEDMCVQPGIVRAVEGRVLDGLHPRLPVLSLPAPPGSRRVPSPTTVDFVLEDSTPDSISEVSCLSEASPWGTGSIHTLSRGWAWQELCMASVNLPQLKDPAAQPPAWGTDAPESPPCYHVLLFWLPLDPPESPSLPT